MGLNEVDKLLTCLHYKEVLAGAMTVLGMSENNAQATFGEMTYKELFEHYPVLYNSNIGE